MNSGVDQLPLAIRAATTAGLYLRERLSRPVSVLTEVGKDIKTKEDLEAERRILDALAPSNLPVLTEETGLHGKPRSDDDYWVIDPLDGTLNYSRGLPLCCVSIALWRERQPVFGVIHEFLHDRLFTGVVGVGAACNGAPIAVSRLNEPARAVIATGFPSGASYDDAQLREFVGRVQHFKKVRLLGSAALSLAHVAAGAIDIYAENGIHFWDVAAGLALVKAAGGDFQLSPFDSQWRCNASATNGALHFI